MVIDACAFSHASEVEAQHGQAITVQRLRRVVHDFVVHVAAVEGMRMAYQSSERRPRVMGRRPENRLQRSCWAVDENGFVAGCHNVSKASE